MVKNLKEGTWIHDIVAVYAQLGGEAHYSDVYPLMEHRRVSRGASWPPSAQQTIQGTIEDHSPDSDRFKGKAVFYSVEGLGKGIWGLLSEYTHSEPKTGPSKTASISTDVELEKVYIANFGEGNSLWPRVLENSTIATFSELRLFDFWQNEQKPQFIDWAVQNTKTARGFAPTRAVAGRWYNLVTELRDTVADLWISKQGDVIWWTVSKGGELKASLIPSGDVDRFGPNVQFLEKPCSGWSDKDLKGRPLRWNTLHPKTKDFLSTEATFQKVADDRGYASFCKAMVKGEDLRPWYETKIFSDKQKKSKSAGRIFSAKERMAYQLANTMIGTVAAADGRVREQRTKVKDTSMTHDECMSFVIELYDLQEGQCSYSKLPMQLHGEEDDKQMLVSLDRIDSDLGYHPENLHLVCRFINRWKSDDPHELFSNLIGRLTNLDTRIASADDT